MYRRQIAMWGVVVAALLLALSGVCRAEEIAPFRFTGFDGYAMLNYLADTEQQGVGAAKNAVTTMQEEVFINTHSYFYHPNFLKMDLGGGPLFVQDRVEAGGLVNRESSELYNLAGRLSFLEQKSTPFALYYEHLNPTVSTSLTQSFIQTNTKTGAILSVREPLSPVLVTAEAFRQRSKGRSTSLNVDDEIEQVSARLSTNFGPDNYGQFYYQVNRLQTASGNPDLPITPSQVDSHTASFDGRFLFGAQQQLAYTQVISVNSLSYSRADYQLDHKDFRFSPDLRWQHSDSLSSFYNYSFYKSDETVVEVTNQAARVGVNYSDKDRLSIAADVHATNDRITGRDTRASGVGTQANYSTPWENAVLRLSAGIIYDQNDRTAAATLIAVVGERITLVDGIAVTLTQEYIDIATIRVFNLDRTQEYTLTDYRIIVIGTRTQIQRLATGSILDGQEVLVDYAFQSGGSARYTYLNQNYQVSLTLYRNYTAYIRYLDASYNLVTGAPTLPFNSLRNTLFGLRVDQPLLTGMTVGGEVMFEYQDEEISPYRRQSYDAYVQLPVLARMSPRISIRRLFVEYSNSPEDVDLTGWTLQLSANPWNYTSLTAEATYEKDTGGSLRRVLLRNSLGIEWRLRQLSVRGEAQYTREQLGSFDRNRKVIRIMARRDF
jgi:hypothetical protein